MTRRSLARTIAGLIAFLTWPALAGPGGFVASLAALLGDDHAHRISLVADRGHDDIVFCHDEPSVDSTPAMAIAASDCADDHRLHVASSDQYLSRGETKLAPRVETPVRLTSVANPSPAVATHAAGPADATALRVAIEQQRTVVLQV